LLFFGAELILNRTRTQRSQEDFLLLFWLSLGLLVFWVLSSRPGKKESLTTSNNNGTTN